MLHYLPISKTHRSETKEIHIFAFCVLMNFLKIQFYSDQLLTQLLILVILSLEIIKVLDNTQSYPNLNPLLIQKFLSQMIPSLKT